MLCHHWKRWTHIFGKTNDDKINKCTRTLVIVFQNVALVILTLQVPSRVNVSVNSERRVNFLTFIDWASWRCINVYTIDECTFGVWLMVCNKSLILKISHLVLTECLFRTNPGMVDWCYICWFKSIWFNFLFLTHYKGNITKLSVKDAQIFEFISVSGTQPQKMKETYQEAELSSAISAYASPNEHHV